MANANNVDDNIVPWLAGSISPVSGVGTSPSGYIRTTLFYTFKDTPAVSANEGYNISVFIYNENGTYIGIVNRDGKTISTNAESLRALTYCDLSYAEVLYPNMQYKIVAYKVGSSDITRDDGALAVTRHTSPTYGLNEMRVNAIQSIIAWEYGDISYSDNGPYHIGLRSPMYRYRVRTPIDSRIYLKAGDTIFIPTGKQLLYGCTDVNGSYTRQKSWLTGERLVTIKTSGNYDLLLTNVTASEITDIDAFVSDVIITTYTHSVADLILSTKRYSNVPKHFVEPLNTLIATKKQRELISDGNGDSFVFVTDVHWQQNMQNSPALIGEILRRTNTKMVVFGGDILNIGSTTDYGVTVERKFYEALDSEGILDCLYPVIGNHDWNDNVASTYPNAHLDNYVVYSLMYKQTENHVTELPKITGTEYTNSFYYYADNENQKIRYLFVNNAKASLGETQTAWITTKVTELSSEWTIVCFAHMYWYNVTNGVPNVTEVGISLKTLLDNLSGTASATIAALIVGHCHYDYSVKSQAGYWIIATTTDCVGQSSTELSPTMTIGTDTEQAFDLFTLDIRNHTIYADRIGAGNERVRTFTYLNE